MATVTSTVVSAVELLAAREERAAGQTAALAQFRKPLISLTIVMPGPRKNGPLPLRVMDIALQELDFLIEGMRWPLLSRQIYWPNTGPEALYVVDTPSEVLKSAVMDLEERHPMGRLWDIDVIASTGTPLSRAGRGKPRRACLLCSRPAHECGRSRRHSLPELINTIGRIVNDFDLHSGY